MFFFPPLTPLPPLCPRNSPLHFSIRVWDCRSLLDQAARRFSDADDRKSHIPQVCRATPSQFLLLMRPCCFWSKSHHLAKNPSHRALSSKCAPVLCNTFKGVVCSKMKFPPFIMRPYFRWRALEIFSNPHNQTWVSQRETLSTQMKPVLAKEIKKIINKSTDEKHNMSPFCSSGRLWLSFCLEPENVLRIFLAQISCTLLARSPVYVSSCEYGEFW